MCAAAYVCKQKASISDGTVLCLTFWAKLTVTVCLYMCGYGLSFFLNILSSRRIMSHSKNLAMVFPLLSAGMGEYLYLLW